MASIQGHPPVNIGKVLSSQAHLFSYKSSIYIHKSY